MKPMLASDWAEDKVKLPVIAQPKIDGVRGLNMTGVLTGRSLKQHANKHVTQLFSHPDIVGFDGEFAAEIETHSNLCSLTTSALSTIEGEPYVLLWVFDYITDETVNLPYQERYEIMNILVHKYLVQQQNEPGNRLRVVPSVLCRTMEDLLTTDDMFLDMGFEGTIIRDPHGKHKQGRSTVREGGLLRIKRFIDAEFEITEVVEGVTNTNDAQQNELGQQFRSTHQENMVPNGMVGALMGTLIKDVIARDGAILFKKGDTVKVGAGKLSHNDRIKFFREQSLILGRIGKFQLFPKGIKDKPRFPTFQCFRSKIDM